MLDISLLPLRQRDKLMTDSLETKEEMGSEQGLTALRQQHEPYSKEGAINEWERNYCLSVSSPA